MPEGDTILRTARSLQRALGGQVLTAVRSTVASVSEEPLAGRTVTHVEARGKNLLIHLDHGRVLYTHMRMTGSWHIYRPGEKWRKRERGARLVLETAGFVAVCFHAPVVELIEARRVRHHPVLGQLGPDVLAAEFDFEEARRRLRVLAERPIGEAVLAQHAVCGIGNVYKSEVLFLCGTCPQALVRDLNDDDLDRILRKARALMSDNLTGFPRVTRKARFGARHWVYGRSGQDCDRCGTTIRMRRQGPAGRSTYWCPTCQPPRGTV